MEALTIWCASLTEMIFFVKRLFDTDDTLYVSSPYPIGSTSKILRISGVSKKIEFPVHIQGDPHDILWAWHVEDKWVDELLDKLVEGLKQHGYTNLIVDKNPAYEVNNVK